MTGSTTSIRHARAVLAVCALFVAGSIALVGSRELGAEQSVLRHLFVALIATCGAALVVRGPRYGGVILVAIAVSYVVMAVLAPSAHYWLGWTVASTCGLFAAALWPMFEPKGCLDRSGVFVRWLVALGLYFAIFLAFVQGSFSRDHFVLGGPTLAIIVLIVQSCLSARALLRKPPRPGQMAGKSGE